MKKLIAIVALCALTGTAFAAKVERVKVGGKGKVAIVNACEAPSASLETAANKIGNLLMINIEVKKGEWKFAEAKKSLEATGANAAVFVVKDAALPISLIAMEDKWGVVNADGLEDKSIEKEVLRVATVILGGASSKYPASSMRPVFSKEDISKKAGEIITFDSIMAIFGYLPELGIKQFKMMAKDDAIEEGLIKADAKK